MNRYGNGFHDGAAFVFKLRVSVWCPHTSQPYGSNPGRVFAQRTSSAEKISSPAPVAIAGCLRIKPVARRRGPSGVVPASLAGAAVDVIRGATGSAHRPDAAD